MIEFIGGIFSGIILLFGRGVSKLINLWILFIAWVDDQFMGAGIQIPKTRFNLFLIASCWELLFFIGGFFVGRFFL